MTELVKKNKIVLIYTLLTELVIVIATALELIFGGVSPMVMFGIVSIIITNSIICGTVFKKNQSSENFRYIAIGGFLVVFLLIVFCVETFWIFFIPFPMLSVITIYENKKIVIVAGAVFNIINFIGLCRHMYELYRTNRTLYNGWISLTVVLIMLAYTLSIIVTTAWIKEENTNKLKEVEIQQEKSKTLAREVIDIGNTIKEYAYNSEDIINELDVSTDNALNIFDHIIKGNTANFELVEKQGEMTSNIRNMLKNVENEVEYADVMTHKSSEKIEESYVSVDDLKDKSKIIIRSNEELLNSIEYFIDSIKKIKVLLGGISEISEQTEMLALNASIESARAGEAGKGFVHVSNQISNLADNTSNLTSDINSVVERLENSALRAKVVAMDVFNNVNEENNILETTYNDLKDMNSSLHNLSQNIKAVYGRVGNIVDFSEKIEGEARELYAASVDAMYKTNDTVSLNQDNKTKTKNSKDLINNLIVLTDKMDKFIKA